MTTSEFDTTSTHDDDAFDARARSTHATAQGALSPRVRAQLQQRRRAVLASPRKTHGVRWVPTLTMAATLALAVGMGLRLWSPETANPDAAAPATAAADTRAEATSDTSPGPTSRPDTALPAVAAAGRNADAATASAPAASTAVEDRGAAETSTGHLEADVDAIAALLAAPAVDDGDSAPDAAVVETAQDDALLAALEESPDFYLWLGADDSAGVEAL